MANKPSWINYSLKQTSYLRILLSWLGRSTKAAIVQIILLVFGGGAPIGIAVQEFLDVLGVASDHIAIRTSYYTGIDKRDKNVRVYGLNYMIKKLQAKDSLLIVDDVHDTGLSIDQVISDLKTACQQNTPEIRIATPYFKPTKNKTNRQPDYYIHETDKWLVFPHELEGLTLEEIRANKPELAQLMDEIEPILK